MAKSKIPDVIERHGKSLSEILKEKFQEHGNIVSVAADLGVSQGTVSHWLIRCGLEIKSVLVQRHEANQCSN